MFTQRRINELDSFISNNHNINKIMSPRTQPFANLTNPRKPMINLSPVPAPKLHNNTQINRLKLRPQELDSSRDHFCSNENHYNRKAEYIIHIEDEDMYYCGVCATQAASQGFVVNKIASLKKQKILPYYPHLASNKRYHEVQDLMKQIIKLEA